MGAPLVSSSGEVIGIIVVLDSKPIVNSEVIQAYFDLVTNRIAAEYDRLLIQHRLELQEQKFRDLTVCSTDFMWELDASFHYTMYSSHRDSILGYEPEEILGKNPFDFLAIKESPGVAEIFNSLKETKRSFKSIECAMVSSSGEIVYVETSGVPIFAEDGEFLGYRGVDHDISERKRRELELQLASTVLETASEAVMVTDPQHMIIKVNRAFTRITGYTEEEVLGRKPYQLNSAIQDEYFYQQLSNTLQQRDQWDGEIWSQRKDGEAYPVWTSISSMYSETGVLMGYVALFNDITLRKKHEEKIAYQANYDALTGLANRHSLENRFENALKHAIDNHKQVALLFIDLDRFKQINDSLGHFIGDKLLQEAALRLNKQVRGSDIAARLGGDEFAVVVPDINDVEEIEHLAQQIVASFQTPFKFDCHELYISASIGITLFPDDGQDIKTLLRNADNAMYRSKDDGRNRYQFYTQQMHKEAERRHVLENALRRAISGDEFELHYQPIVHAESLMPVGCEALIRWHSSELGYIMPNDFIPLAEEVGLIDEIGAWVIQQACAQGAQLPAGISDDFFISINISSYQFQTGTLISNIKNALMINAQPPSRIVFEITERLMVNENESVCLQLQQLKELGIGLSIDDFGTGYSSLSYLHKYPISTLKIDRAFIQEVEQDPKIQALVKAIIAMSESLGLKTVAEGIETQGQAEFLAANHCHCIQGFLYGKPIPFEQLIQQLQPS